MPPNCQPALPLRGEGIGLGVPAGTLYVQSVPVGTLERFYRNTVEISENSENHLKAIVGARQLAGVDGFSGETGKVAERTQGEGKAPRIRERDWHSPASSANYLDLRGIPLLASIPGNGAPGPQFKRGC
jgi:hypothetical protein